MSQVIAIAADGEFTCWDAEGGDLITFGMVEILSDYTLGRELLVRSQPRSAKYFTDRAQEVHGISYWKAMTFQSPKESCLEILHWMKPNLERFPLEFVYHGNGNLDWRWLTAHFRKEEMEASIQKAFSKDRITSTVSMSRKNLKNLENHKLNTVAKHYNIELDHHNALSDARACAQIYCNIKLKKDIWTGKFL